ncbi:MAG: hypothetical protein ACYDCO_05195 [Armatimonadota bacterium]
MLNVGFATRDITPEPGLTLSGFAARCNQPSQGVDDSLSVFALAVNDGLLLVFDLLGLGPELLEEIQAELDTRLPDVPRENRVLTCTHTHSAPASITLLGCGIVEPTYWQQVKAAAREAALAAWHGRRAATMRITSADIAGASYNRRSVLADGRVVMAQHPDKAVVKVGPTLDRMLLIRFDDEAGRGIAGIAHAAIHACTVCTPQISADYPGELRRRLAEQHGFPFLFLQGACGDINPPWEEMTRATMLQNVDFIMEKIGEMPWPASVAVEPFRMARATVPLDYAALPPRETLQAMRDGMDQIATTGRAPAETLAMLANILNAEPEQEASPMTRYMAATLRDWSDRTLARYDDAPDSYDLSLAAWRIGPLVLCFMAAEVFAEYALHLRDAFPEFTTVLVGYASPHVGYLPTDEAQFEGGYEVDSAYRFYNHPAPWAVGMEGRVMEAVKAMVEQLS